MSTSTLLSTIPPAAYPLSVGLLATSSLLFGNLGLGACGPIPILKGEIGNVRLSGKQKAAIWEAFFDAAAQAVVSGTLLTTVVHLTAVPLLQTRNLKILSATSALLSISVVPYTLTFIAATNSRIKAMNKKEELTASEDDQVDELVRKWDTLHKLRYGFYGPAWACGLVTLVGVLRL